MVRGWGVSWGLSGRAGLAGAGIYEGMAGSRGWDVWWCRVGASVCSGVGKRMAVGAGRWGLGSHWPRAKLLNIALPMRINIQPHIYIYIYRVLIAVQIQWCFSIVEHTRQTKHTNVLQEWVCHECHKDLTRTCMYMDKTPTAKIYVHVHKQIRHHLRTLLLSPFLSRAICSSLLIFSPRSLCPTHSRSDSLCVHIYKDGY